LMMSQNVFTPEGEWYGTREDVFFDFPSHGGLIITTQAMGLILQGILQRDPGLLRPETWDLWLRDEEHRGYHLGWKVAGAGQDRYLYHPGGAIGIASEIRLYPQKDLGLFFVTNTLDAQKVSTREMPNLSRFATQPVQAED
jgi:hypothetical protein